MPVSGVLSPTIDRLDMEGALVMNVAPGSGAQRGGLKPTRRLSNGDVEIGDLIVAVNDEAIRSNNDLLLTLEKYKPGDVIKVTIKRDNRTSTLTIELGSSL
jgi:S1-C subfamily serine protease